MKVEIEVYDLDEPLFYINNNEISTFSPKSLHIRSEYSGYSGNNWGDTANNKGGYPIVVYYSPEPNYCKTYIKHSRLFRTKEELLKSL